MKLTTLATLLISATSVLSVNIARRGASGGTKTLDPVKRLAHDHKSLKQASRRSILRRAQLKEAATKTQKRKGRALVPRQSASAYPVCESYDPNGSSYARIQGYNVPGFNLGERLGPGFDEDECVRLCDATTECGGNGFIQGDGFCWTKQLAVIGGPIVPDDDNVWHSFKDVTCGDLEAFYDADVLASCCNAPARDYPVCTGDLAGLAGYAVTPGWNPASNDIAPILDSPGGVLACQERCNDWGEECRANYVEPLSDGINNRCCLKSAAAIGSPLLGPGTGDAASWRGVTCQQLHGLYTGEYGPGVMANCCQG